MHHTVTLQGYDGSTTIIPFDGTITIATLLQRYQEQTGYGGCIELLDMDHRTEHPVEQGVMHYDKILLCMKYTVILMNYE